MNRQDSEQFTLAIGAATAFLGTRAARMFLAVVVVTCGAGLIVATAAEPRFVAPEVVAAGEGQTSSGAYCGVYSLYGALQAVGVHCEMPQFLRPEYVESRAGSSAYNLVRAAEDAGAHALVMSGMNAETLRATSLPVLLHVSDRAGLNRRRFDHWILYLGSDGEKARIVEAPRPLESTSYAGLLARWDGTGIVVSKEPIDSFAPVWLVLPQLILDLSIVAIVVCLLSVTGLVARSLFDDNRQPPAGRIAWQAGMLLLMATVLSVLYSWGNQDGILANMSAAQAVAASYDNTLAPRVFVANLAELGEQENLTLIDARYPDAFARGTIPGAVNLPLDAGEEVRISHLKNKMKSDPLIVFCQSQRCAYSDQVARQLVADGFENVRVLHGGFRDWEKWQANGDRKGSTAAD